MMQRCRSHHVFVLVPLLTIALVRQSLGQDQERAFEVASIKASNGASSGPQGLITLNPGGLHASGVPLYRLITYAYQLQDYELVNVPSWVKTSRFDVDARPGIPTNAVQMRMMARLLLRDRFELELAKEQTKGAVYKLQRARNDGRLGPALREADTPCDSTSGEFGFGRNPSTATDLRPEQHPCWLIIGSTGSQVILIARRLSIPGLAEALSRPPSALGRRVVDDTGLSGEFAFMLEWAPPLRTTLGNDPATARNVADLPVALEEQLGLRLEDAEATIDVWAVRKVEMLREN